MGQQREGRQDAKTQPFPQGQMRGSERRRQERYFRHGKLQQESNHTGRYHQLVVKVVHPEYGLAHIRIPTAWNSCDMPRTVKA